MKLATILFSITMWVCCNVGFASDLGGKMFFYKKRDELLRNRLILEFGIPPKTRFNPTDKIWKSGLITLEDYHKHVEYLKTIPMGESPLTEEEMIKQLKEENKFDIKLRNKKKKKKEKALKKPTGKVYEREEYTKPNKTNELKPVPSKLLTLQEQNAVDSKHQSIRTASPLSHKKLPSHSGTKQPSPNRIRPSSSIKLNSASSKRSNPPSPKKPSSPSLEKPSPPSPKKINPSSPLKSKPSSSKDISPPPMMRSRPSSPKDIRLRSSSPKRSRPSSLRSNPHTPTRPSPNAATLISRNASRRNSREASELSFSYSHEKDALESARYLQVNASRGNNEVDDKSSADIIGNILSSVPGERVQQLQDELSEYSVVMEKGGEHSSFVDVEWEDSVVDVDDDSYEDSSSADIIDQIVMEDDSVELMPYDENAVFPQPPENYDTQRKDYSDFPFDIESLVELPERIFVQALTALETTMSVIEKAKNQIVTHDEVKNAFDKFKNISYTNERENEREDESDNVQLEDWEEQFRRDAERPHIVQTWREISNYLLNKLKVIHNAIDTIKSDSEVYGVENWRDKTYNSKYETGPFQPIQNDDEVSRSSPLVVNRANPFQSQH